ncbi:OLC1v1023192C2 [Oldenlandia corymbosa var. corymbosa]|uniref:tRNA dimethylallyltransferase n=1 Tax=Oldenlandia corymbosa var. corymbosa TaxID=529605 RepID=A0AAV1C2C4_OLDCO|nr:OLC1v1023192C2 [Oldenlandia corymbosa var. corymbosa]
MIGGAGAGARLTCLCVSYTAETHLLRSGLLSFHLHRRLRRSRLFTTTTTTCSASDKKQKVIVISGPTGAGKSKLALELAKRLNGEIISADSVQVYQGLDVGSAKPTPSERKEVRHHLIDILHPSEDYSVGQFFLDARQATKDVLNSGRTPIVVGGTGLYLRWFIYGKPDVPKASLEIASEVYSELASLETIGDWDGAVQLVVKAGDPSAQSLARNDWYRLRRRLEIIKSSGSPTSAFQVPYDSFREPSDFHGENSVDISSSIDGFQENKSKNLDYEFLCFFLSTQRLDLYRSIDFRCEDMLSGDDGILSEASWLLDLGLLPNSNSATRAIGYRQAMEYLLKCREQGGQSSARDFIAFLSEFQKASRNFAKRQLTWFRNEQIYHWIDASKPLEKVLKFIEDSYHDETGTITLPKSLEMKKDISNRKETSDLKAYRPRNRLFVEREDISGVLEWIRKNHKQPSLSVC